MSCLKGHEATEHKGSCEAATKSTTLAAAESDLLHCNGPACWSSQSPITAAENDRNGIMLPKCMGDNMETFRATIFLFPDWRPVGVGESSARRQGKRLATVPRSGGFFLHISPG
jgi:hypothetical protein